MIPFPDVGDDTHLVGSEALDGEELVMLGEEFGVNRGVREEDAEAVLDDI